MYNVQTDYKGVNALGRITRTSHLSRYFHEVVAADGG